MNNTHDTEQLLIAEFAYYCDAHKLEKMSADELIWVLNSENNHMHDLWLSNFIMRWEAIFAN